MNFRIILPIFVFLAFVLVAVAQEGSFTAQTVQNISVCSCSSTDSTILIQNTGNVALNFSITQAGSAAKWSSIHPAYYANTATPVEFVNRITAPCEASGQHDLKTTFSTDTGLKKSFTQNVKVDFCEGVSTVAEKKEPSKDDKNSLFNPLTISLFILPIIIILALFLFVFIEKEHDIRIFKEIGNLKKGLKAIKSSPKKGVKSEQVWKPVFKDVPYYEEPAVIEKESYKQPVNFNFEFGNRKNIAIGIIIFSLFLIIAFGVAYLLMFTEPQENPNKPDFSNVFDSFNTFKIEPKPVIDDDVPRSVFIQTAPLDESAQPKGNILSSPIAYYAIFAAVGFAILGVIIFALNFFRNRKKGQSYY